MTLTAELPVAVEEARALTPLERLETLCDPGSFRPLRSAVRSGRAGDRAVDGDGVLAGAGTADGRPIFCYSEDPAFMGGSLGEAHAETIVRVMRLAGRAGAPVVGFVESGGARLQEGHAALAAYGRIFREAVALSGRVPQISIVAGVSAGGGAYAPALTDFVVMTERRGCSSPDRESSARRSARSARWTSSAGRAFMAPTASASSSPRTRPTRSARRAGLLALLPAPLGTPPPRRPVAAAERGGGRRPSPGAPGLRRARRDRGDCRRRRLAGALRRLGAQHGHRAGADRWPRSVGVIANQPWRLGGVIDAAAAEKGARFVDACDRFGLPLVVLVDTPGFMPGRRQEQAGVIRQGAALLRAFAAATVPRLTVVLRKAYGGAVITMNSKELGADMVFAWPAAEIGIMASSQAVGIVERRRIAAAPQRRPCRRACAGIRGRAPDREPRQPPAASSTR